MRHLARVCPRLRAKSGKMACQMTLIIPYFLATTPCENELFATDGQIMAGKGSHNVKKRAVFFYVLRNITQRKIPLSCKNTPAHGRKDDEHLVQNTAATSTHKVWLMANCAVRKCNES